MRHDQNVNEALDPCKGVLLLFTRLQRQEAHWRSSAGP
jgi:hypothetical protein